MMQKKIVILGTGPTGLGAAWRLKELGHTNYKVFEKRSYPGGLASSFIDKAGFTWDIGGHVQFSHYKYFDDLMDLLLKDEWIFHDRESWVWIKDRFVPYPFQNNIKYLPKEDMWKCLNGLIDIYKNPLKKPKNFKEWILATFGKGLADAFMFPYNYKVWAYPPEMMSYKWIGERVAVTDLSRVTKNILFDTDDISWGPNNKFRFPLRGGTGEIWKKLYEKLDKDKIHFNHEFIKIDSKEKKLFFQNGHVEDYDHLITTIPLDAFIRGSDLKYGNDIEDLLFSSTHVFGIGLKGKPPEHLQKKCWMYFPENNCPFYRVTVFSNYSPNNVPDISKQWSLMLEVSESKHKPVNHETIMDEVIEGMISAKLISSKEEIIDKWYHFEKYGYPTPSINRDSALKILKKLDRLGIFSRGRFGAWKYEVSNQDHSLMQGVEIIERLIDGKEEITVWHPEIANKR